MKLRTELVLITVSTTMGVMFGTGLAKGIDYNLFSAIGAMLAGIGALGTWYVAYRALNSWKVKRDYSELTTLQRELEDSIENLEDSMTHTQNYVYSHYYSGLRSNLKGLDVRFTELLYDIVDNERKVLRVLDDILLILEDHGGSLPKNLITISNFFIEKHSKNYELHKQGLINRFDKAGFDKASQRHVIVMAEQLSAAQGLKEDVRKLI